jgi:hypothetical protein
LQAADGIAIEMNASEENKKLVGACYVYYVLGLTFVYYSICSIPAYYCFTKISDWDTGKNFHKNIHF